MSVLTFRARGAARVRRINPGLRQPLAVAGAVIALAWVVIAIFAPLIAPSNPLAQTFTPGSGPHGTTCSAPTSSAATSSAG